MRALVVYDSLYGNTRAVAEGVAAGLAIARPDVDIRCLPAPRAVGPPPAFEGVDLLVLGCPTHALGMSSVRSRSAQVAKDRAQAPELGHDADVEGPGVRELLDLPAGLQGLRAAAFDTRLDSRFAGGAARRIARRLRRRGAMVVGQPTGFVVLGMRGPLRGGELERARAWGAGLGALLPGGAQRAPSARGV